MKPTFDTWNWIFLPLSYTPSSMKSVGIDMSPKKVTLWSTTEKQKATLCWYVKPLKVTLYQSLLQCLITLCLITLIRTVINEKSFQSHKPYSVWILLSEFHREKPVESFFGSGIVVSVYECFCGGYYRFGRDSFLVDIGLPEPDIEGLAFYHAVYVLHPGIVIAGKLLSHAMERRPKKTGRFPWFPDERKARYGKEGALPTLLIQPLTAFRTWITSFKADWQNLIFSQPYSITSSLSWVALCIVTSPELLFQVFFYLLE